MPFRPAMPCMWARSRPPSPGPIRSAPIAWGIGGLIAATRIVLLAHWTTDVLAGLAMGALVERCLRPLSGGVNQAIGGAPSERDARTAATNEVIQARRGAA